MRNSLFSPREARFTNDDPQARAARIHDLELKYREGLHRSEVVYCDEGTRRLKLKMIALRDENARLEDRIRHNDASKKQLTRQHQEARDELKEARDATRAQDAKLKKQEIEIDTLKVSREELKSWIKFVSNILDRQK